MTIATLDKITCQLYSCINQTYQHGKTYTDTCVITSQDYVINYVDEQIANIQAILGCEVDLANIVTKEYVEKCTNDHLIQSYNYTDCCNSITVNYYDLCINEIYNYINVCNNTVQNTLDTCLNEQHVYTDSCVNSNYTYVDLCVNQLNTYNDSCINTTTNYMNGCINETINYVNTCINNSTVYVNQCINESKIYTNTCVNNLYNIMNACRIRTYCYVNNNYIQLGYSAGSAGALQDPVIVSNSLGTLTLQCGYYNLYSGSSFESPLLPYFFDTCTFCFSTGVNNYLVVQYNNGSPKMEVLTSRDSIHQSDVVPVLTVFKNEDCSLNYIDWDAMARGLSNKISDRLVRTQRFALEEGGLVLAEVPTRVLTISSGVVWYGGANAVLSPSRTDTTCTFLYYHCNSEWTNSLVTQYNNLQYDTLTNIATLQNSNSYGVNWIYRSVSNVNEIYIVLGNADYTQSSAQDSRVPPLPPKVQAQSILVGRVIVNKSASSAANIDSAFNTIFNTSLTNNHNMLLDLQGGSAPFEYYHMSCSMYYNNVNRQRYIDECSYCSTLISKAWAKSYTDTCVSYVNTNLIGYTDACRNLLRTYTDTCVSYVNTNLIGYTDACRNLLQAYTDTCVSYVKTNLIGYTDACRNLLQTYTDTCVSYVKTNLIGYTDACTNLLKIYVDVCAELLSNRITSATGTEAFINCSSNIQLNETHANVFMSQCAYVFLPSAIGIGGRKYIIYNTSLSCAVTIYPCVNQTIAGVNDLVLYPPETATIISNNTNWWLR